MKKIFLLILAAALSAGVAFAQDKTPEEVLNEALELANSGNQALEAGEYALGLEAFQQSLQLASAAGEIGAAHAETCKGAICGIMLKLAKDAYRAKEWDQAIELFGQAKAVATEYGKEDVAAEADELIISSKANQLGDLAAAAKQNKDFATAVGYYQQMVEIDPSNGGYALQLGDAYYRMSDWDNAVAALESAAANGQAVKATNLLSSVYLKRCQEALKAKQYQAAIDFAMKANEYKENANAYKLAASAARASGKLSVCEEMYLKYLEMKPNAADAGDIKLTLAASYQKAGNKAKAREYYNMLVNDPKHGATAKAQLATLK